MDVDVGIVGAGIAGLWLANLLARRGLSVAVCDANGIGGTQTIASQGIVHSGIKYGLGGDAAPAVKALGPMPARWRACLAGDGDIDLRQAQVVAEHVHLYAPTTSSLPRTLFASALLAGQAKRLAAPYPAPFGRGTLLALDDFVLDLPSLVRALAAPLQGRLIALRVRPQMLVRAPAGIVGIRSGNIEIRASAFVFAAGRGNESLGAAAGFKIAMQQRPLHQIMATLTRPPKLFAHCLLKAFGTEPDMTITSHGRTLYVGGRVASDPTLGEAQRIAAVRDGLSCLPGIDLTGAVFRIQRAVRAEPRREARLGGDVFAQRRGNCVLCWPIKLSLAPRLGDVVLDLLADLKPKPQASLCDASPLPAPPYVEPPWASARPAASEQC